MKLKDFTNEAIAPIPPIGSSPGGNKMDSAIAANQQPGKTPAQKLPYNQSKVGNALGAVGAGALNKVSGSMGKGGMLGTLGNALKAGLNPSVANAVDASHTGIGSQAFANKMAGNSEETAMRYVPGQPDPKVIDYLKQASKGVPLTQGTGNTDIDDLLRNAGLIK